MSPAPWLLARWVGVVRFCFSERLGESWLSGFWMLVFRSFFHNNYDLRSACPETAIRQAQCLHFGTLGDGHLGRPRKQQKGHLRIQSQIFSDLVQPSGAHFASCFSTLKQNRCRFVCSFPAFVFAIVCSESGRAELESKHLCENVCKQQFSQVSEVCLFYCPNAMFF